MASNLTARHPGTSSWSLVGPSLAGTPVDRKRQVEGSLSVTAEPSSPTVFATLALVALLSITSVQAQRVPRAHTATQVTGELALLPADQSAPGSSAVKTTIHIYAISGHTDIIRGSIP